MIEKRTLDTHALHLPRELPRRIAAHALKKAQHRTLVGSFRASVTEAPYTAGDECMALVRRHCKIERDGAIEEGPRLGQSNQLSISYRSPCLA